MSVSKTKSDPELRFHKEWLGLLQPVGLVVSPLALVRKQAVVNRDGAVHLQAQLASLVDDTDPGRPAILRNLPSLLESVLGWQRDEYLGHGSDSGSGSGSGSEPGRAPLPETLEVRLPELGELLRPTYALPDLPAADAKPEDPPKWLMLVQELPTRTPLDDKPKDSGRGWHTSPHAKFERMLWELEVPIGLLSNGETLRLVYAPRGETSGHLSFPVGAMTAVANRPMLGALHMLLSADRLLGESDDRRLPALLEESRKYQNEVSTQLAEQVLGALIELLRGFAAADEAAKGELLADCTGRDPKHIYGGLLTVLLRLVFLLYAEDRGLLPDDPTWAGNYSVVGLFERLREDAGRYPDTMDQRYGAWAWLLTLYRLVFLGGGHGEAIHLPARRGQLFDPNEYPFLEGRHRGEGFDPGERLEPPRVSDGTIFRVLQGLLILDGERLSYRSLDVEQIGSVYESMMGYEVEQAKGPSIGLGKQHVVVNLDALLGQKPGSRAKWLQDHANVKLTGNALSELKQAKTADDAVAALQRRVSTRTPTILPPGALYLQPGEERRRTGSHYTPRSLTEPIVRTTLRPVLEDLGPRPTEAQILALKVCDPAMGSGAFLVEACRQLAQKLVDAWDMHGIARVVPADEEPLLHARRLVAEHCLYGVDKNPFAVNLAKLSLWLATLAKKHPFTFLDHALKCGDSLVGLTRRQIAEFRWDEEVVDDGPLFARVREQVVKAAEARLKIHAEGEDADDQKRRWNAEAEAALVDARLRGDAVIAAFFGEEKAKAREKRRVQLWDLVQRWDGGDLGARAELEEVVAEMCGRGVVPFHWEIEFPEVFDSGFDAVFGNPPFLGGARISRSMGTQYLDWVLILHVRSHGNADILAHFLRRSGGLLHGKGTLGFIATNTVSQGDTRESGLFELMTHGFSVYSARRRIPWPGAAAVIISTICLSVGMPRERAELDGGFVQRISAFLFPGDDDCSPARLRKNMNSSFQGVKVYGQGFLFDDADQNASPLSELDDISRSHPAEVEAYVLPYMGGRDLNSSASPSHRRFAINFGDLSQEAAQQQSPLLFKIVETKVKPERMKNNRAAYRKYWWQHGERRVGLLAAIQGKEQILACSQTSKYLMLWRLGAKMVFDQKLIIFADGRPCMFGILQSTMHASWAKIFGSTMKDDPVYTPTDCFETFPFPKDWQTNQSLETAGQTYYDYRAAS